jgi:two-component system, response regulator FlrC
MSPRVMIIDDDPDICESLKDRLEAMGYEVITAQDGRTGLALMALESKGSAVAGVFLDVQMAVMDGMEVLRILRRRHPEIPVLMMSAGSDPRLLDEALRMGAKEYLVKPLDPAHIDRICAQLFPLSRGA